MPMSLIHNRPTFAVIVLLASLAAAVGARAQTKPKTTDPAKAPKKSAAALKAEENYKTICQVCHLADGKGMIPDMSLNDGVWKHGGTLQAIAKSIRDGAPGTLMLPFKDKFSEEEIQELAKFVKAFEPKKAAPSKTKK
jgi:cytochrome c553